MIRGKLHRLMDVMEPSPVKKLFQDSPLYVFEEDIIELLLKSESSTKSIMTLAEAGLLHLPYPYMTVQFDSSTKAGTWFVAIEEMNGKFMCISAFLFTKQSLVICEGGSEVTVTPTAFDITTNGQEADGYASAIAVRLACLMTHVSGLEREHIDPPEKLNKIRKRHGKPRIGSCSYVHIATVVDRDGKSYAYTGRHMPVHMRAGHIRNQAFGKERAERKPIWIPPVIVNYRDDEEKPRIEKRIVR